MNYLKELSVFYNKIDTIDLPANAILLWYTLMSIANNLCWREELSITLSMIECKSKLSKPTIWRMRKLLEDRGFLEYRSTGGRSCGIYRLTPLAFHSEIQNDFAFQSKSITEMQTDFAFQSESISETQSDFAFQSENILNISNIDINKENIKRKIEVGAVAPPSRLPPEKRKEKSCAKKEKKKNPHWNAMAWLDGLEPPWGKVMQGWLEYKKSRGQQYRNEMSAVKCFEQLKRLSGGNAEVASKITDQSIANNWAGLFPLREFSQSFQPQGQYQQPPRGQHIGQIKQPDSAESRQRLLDKFKGSSKNSH